MKPFAWQTTVSMAYRLRLHIGDFTWSEISGRIEAGTVMVNEVVYTHALAQTPWGGVKQSGYGEHMVSLGLLELVTPQHVHVNASPAVADVWWFRYSRLAEIFSRSRQTFTSGSLLQGSLLLPQMLKRLFERR